MTARRVTNILNRISRGGGSRRRRGGGFTLIELLVVISIIVLILALAVPLIGSLRGGRSVDTTPPIYIQGLEIDDDNQEPEYLPVGIAAAFVLPPAAAANPTDYHPYGLVAFDGLGRIENIPAYKITFVLIPFCNQLLQKISRHCAVLARRP